MLRQAILIAFLSLVASQAQAMEIKGLRLGAPTTPGQLAQLYGSAQCPDDLVADALRKMGITRCTVPLSYLGVQTSADIYILDGYAATIRINLPSNLESQVVEFFAARYGEPTTRATTGCSEWRKVDNSNLKLCASREKVEVTFSYSAPSTIDSSDI